MSPLYAECPNCTFPVVVPANELSVARYCRQCRRLFLPEKTAPRQEGRRDPTRRRRQRTAVDSLLRRRARDSA